MITANGDLFFLCHLLHLLDQQLFYLEDVLVLQSLFAFFPDVSHNITS
jgi:hypothetical protein